MEREEFGLAGLIVVAYADRLTEYMVPTVVTPIFQQVDTDIVVFPPFVIQNGGIIGGITGDRKKLEQLDWRAEVTILSNAFPAQNGFVLWIDENMIPHYELEEVASDNLEVEFVAHSCRAIDCLALRNYEQADREAGHAISTGRRSLIPWAAKIAIDRIQGDELGEKVMRNLADDIIANDPVRFEYLVEKYARMGGME